MTSPLIVDVYAGDLGGQPDWHALVALGDPWNGAIIKATEGTSYGPAWFGTNWRAIRAAAGERYGADFFRGCYHFLKFNQDGAKQADFYLKTLEAAGGFAIGDLWPIVDVELGGPSNTNQLASAQQIIECTSTFAARVKTQTGRNVVLYGNGAMRDNGIKNRMCCDLLWCPRYTATLPREIYERAGWDLETLLMWQYCGGGVGELSGYPMHVPGFGAVDISVLVKQGGLDWLRANLWAENPYAAPALEAAPPQILDRVVTKTIEKPAPVGAIAAAGAVGVFGLLTAFARRGKKKGRR